MEKEGTSRGWGWSAVSQVRHSVLELGVCRTQSRQKETREHISFNLRDL